MSTLSRRSLLFAPAVVIAANLMPVRSIERLLTEAGPYIELLDPQGVKLGNPNGARALRGKQTGNKQAEFAYNVHLNLCS
jgi:hypothetical protein